MNRQYNMTESSENFFLLNGHSFPYTLRDAMVVVKPNQDIKLRIANAQHSSMAVHFHGHKAKVTHYDGVKLSEPAQITRDVFDIAAAQRIDLHLQTVDDGLHSFGSGVWLFHDHVETGITTDGMAPGGNISAVVYEDLLDKRGMPKIREEPVNQYFNKSYYARENPVWNMGKFKQSLGDAGLLAVDNIRLIAFGLVLGLILALLLIVVRKQSQGNRK
jgi:FtsP/CotA-like multicopper oxidase with cupredoxin domain